MRWFVNIAAVLTLASALMLGGCSNPPSYKYKLSFEVETPGGIKSGFNVVEISHASVSIPAGGTMTHARGEALYLDLGPGQRPLIALLTSHRDGETNKMVGHWGEVAPFNVLARLYGETFTDYGSKNENIYKLVQYRGAKAVSPSDSDLPDLVTFADIKDPKSVMLVDPGDLAATLGPGVKWKSITLEITDEPLTTGIETWLPWLGGLRGGGLDGKLSGPDDPFIDTLAGRNFKRGN
jgi:hypothetical protein